MSLSPRPDTARVHPGNAGARPPAFEPARALIGFGEVRHRRLKPAAHAFRYPTWFLLLPMRTLRSKPEPLLRRNRFGWLSFHDADHGDGGPDALAWLDARLAEAGLAADGEVWLHTYPRILGHTFKPVSFWYAHAADGALVAIVAEVNNTFGERTAYLLSAEQPGDALPWGRELRAVKRLQVSPFNRIEGSYRFRFLRTAACDGEGQGAAGRTVARIDYDDATGPLLETSVSGRLEPLSRTQLSRALRAMPMLTLGVIARIHAQALKLWLKRVPFIGTDGHVGVAAAPAAAAQPQPPH